ncbi:hypothetical protein NZ30_12950 [Xanthomonas translucens pv. undulosa]|nr:hypothetical protein NZ30_12950 [Xanthomonas translucens pv. undulosa]
MDARGMSAQVVKESLTVAGLCAEQKARAKALRGIVKVPPRKSKKAISASDVGAAVNAVLDDLDNELKRLGVKFSRFRQAYEPARVAVANARVDARHAAKLLERVARAKEDAEITEHLLSKSRKGASA